MSGQIQYELHSITTPDGNTLTLNQGGKMFIMATPTNMGLPPSDIIMSSSLASDGFRFRTARLLEREMEITIRAVGYSRDAYWARRAELINFLRNNRGGLLTYNFFARDDAAGFPASGLKYSIDGIVAEMPLEVADAETWDEWGFTETITVICPDPTFYSTDPITSTLSGGAGLPGASQLKFPISFPITFDAEDFWLEETFLYPGTYKSYPTFTINAGSRPITDITILHEERNVRVRFTRQLAAGRALTLNFATRNYEDEVGIDWERFMITGSAPIDMYLEPARVGSTLANPITTFQGRDSAQNTIRWFLETDTPTEVSIDTSYYVRWIGI